MGLTQFNLSENICFYKYAHNSGPKGSPDMVLNAFDMKFNDKNEGMPPRACRPSKKSNKNQKDESGNDCPARPSARAGGPGAAAPWEEKKGVFPIYPVRCSRCRDWDKQEMASRHIWLLVILLKEACVATSYPRSSTMVG